jgi:hypothetical protein
MNTETPSSNPSKLDATLTKIEKVAAPVPKMGVLVGAVVVAFLAGAGVVYFMLHRLAP